MTTDTRAAGHTAVLSIQAATANRLIFRLLAIAAMISLAAEVGSAPDAPPAHLELPLSAITRAYPPYADFCRRVPVECVLSGSQRIVHSDENMRKVAATNIAVNRAIRFVLDSDQYGAEEYWALPDTGYGDCEDLALEKRSRLVSDGMPSAALRLAIVVHRRFHASHCVLTVETTRGTYILDSQTDDVLRWDQVPYNFETRERTDGRWDRFDQDHWHYD